MLSRLLAGYTPSDVTKPQDDNGAAPTRTRTVVEPDPASSPTAPMADFNQPGQSSSALIATMHIRGPEKIIGTVVVVLLLIAIVMFAGMLRHVYGGARRP